MRSSWTHTSHSETSRHSLFTFQFACGIIGFSSPDARQMMLPALEQSAPVVLSTCRGIAFLGSKIGEGSFAQVFEGRLQDGTPVAVKVINKAKLTQQLDHFIRRELAITQQLHHPNIIDVYDTQEDAEKVFIMMRLASGDLLQHVNERSPLPESEVRFLFKQLIDAVEYTHNAGVVHRDLKLENILLTYRGMDISTPSLYVADWGFGSPYVPGVPTLTERVGSLSYCAPELLAAKTYIGPEVDVWSLGVILYAMLFGMLPFNHPDLNSRRKYIACGFYTMPPSAPPKAAKLIQRMLTVDPARRISVFEVKNHAWMRTPNNNNFIGMARNAFVQLVSPRTSPRSSKDGNPPPTPTGPAPMECKSG